ncbi:NADH-quinone oxidoreductase subunit L [bacterium]|nr:NADH-quinone oxidoreductase subunit L [bacterium]
MLKLDPPLTPRLSGGGGWKLLQLACLLQLGLGVFQLTHSDPLAGIMLLMVGFLGGVIGRFAENYLQGDPARPRFLQWFSCVLVSVTILVTSQNLLIVALAWTATSLALHHLLTLYPDRPGAIECAHKKFLLARLADLSMLGALLLLTAEFGTLDLGSMARILSERAQMTPQLELAACLVAAAAILKSGQVPFHGWLIQVMEAPTPVSALLHAGLINIGGLVLIRTAFLLSGSESAQFLLVAWGGGSALVAGLVGLTQTSAKSMLAWSTCAQMGFMLAECGMGAYPLALLHLVSHSLYKAYRFLGAGEVVAAQRRLRMSCSPELPSRLHWLAAILLVVFGCWLVPAWSPWILAMLPLWLRCLRQLRLWLLAGLLACLYGGQYLIFSSLLPAAPSWSSSLTLATVYCLLLATAFVAIQLAPNGSFARWLYPRAAQGFQLEQRFYDLARRFCSQPTYQPGPTRGLRPLEAP